MAPKILFIVEQFGFHEEKFFKILAKDFDVNVGVYNPSGKIRINRSLEELQIKLRILPKLEDLTKFCKSQNPKLIMTGPLHTLGYLVSKIDPHKIVLLSYGHDILWKDILEKYRDKLSNVLENCLGLIVDCRSSLQSIDSNKFKLPKQTFLIPWGIELADWNVKKSQEDELLMNTDGVIRIVSNRKMESIYNVISAIRAFAHASRKLKNIEMILVGSGSEETNIEREIQALGIESRIIFIETLHHSEMRWMYHQCDVYLSTSLVDGSSVSLLEALYTGLRCVVSDIPSNREWIVDDRAGWLVDPHNVEMIGQSIIEACECSAVNWERTKKKNKTRVLERANFEKNSVGLNKFIHSLI